MNLRKGGKKKKMIQNTLGSMREMSFSLGFKKRTTLEGEKYQRASLVQSHIPAQGMCGHGVRGPHARSVPSGPPHSNWQRRSETVDEGE